MTSSESNNSIISGNNIHDNWYGIFVNIADTTHINNNNLTKNNIAISLFNSTSTNITANYINDNQAGITHHQSSNTLNSNNITNNAIVNIQEVDTTGVVMQSNIWNCGPASLTTVLNRMGINATQEDIADLAGTDKEGTSMWGLVYAAQQYGMLNSTGMIVPVDQLQANNIVLLTMAGLYHFSVITNITNGTVFLADSAFGNINMSIENFAAMYSGYAIITTNNTTNTTNCTNLSIETMQSIKGTWVQVFAGASVGLVAFAAFCCTPVGLVTIAAIVVVAAVVLYANYRYQQSQKVKTPNKRYSSTNPVILSPGYKYTKKYTKSKTTTNTYGKLGSGYVSPTKGYTPTPTVKPADVAYQKTFGEYLDKQTSEFSKIEVYLKNTGLDIVEKRGLDAVNSFPVDGLIKGPKDNKTDDQRWDDVMENLIEHSKKLKDGIKKLDMNKIVIHGTVVGLGIAAISAIATDAIGTDLLKNVLDSITREIKKMEISKHVPG